MLKVLIVEDSQPLGDLFSDFLSLVGYDVIGVARTVRDAVGLANLRTPDLAIIDLSLNGNESGTQVKPLIRQSHTGILYVSGQALSPLLTRHDGEAFVQKPVGLDDLDKALRAVWQIKTRGRPDADAGPRCLHILPSPSADALRIA